MVRKCFQPANGILFGLLAIALNVAAHRFPANTEAWYSRGFYLWVRKAWEWLFAWMPWPAFYLFWICAVAYLGYLGYKTWAQKSAVSRLGYLLVRLLAFSGFMVGSFFLLWGYNYARTPLAKQLFLQPEPLDSLQLWTALERETFEVARFRTQLAGGDTLPLSGQQLWPVSVEDTVRLAVQQWLKSQGFPADSKVRGRMIKPDGLLFSFGASGIYWPWVGEGNLEAGMHPLRVLPAMAHEMSHAYGFGDEGVCNFIAYAALARHNNPYLAYVAHLDYWGDLARACRQQYPARFQTSFLPRIPVGILADEEDIRQQHARYQELAPAIRYQVYDSYLKAQGIASGMLNYNEVIMLVEAWQRRGY
ncbi:MAG: DUF3810 family protein [Saprospiraceae bacterium]|nr:DUF3810 family protein [Saprospiraceae bacterium]